MFIIISILLIGFSICEAEPRPQCYVVAVGYIPCTGNENNIEQTKNCCNFPDRHPDRRADCCLKHYRTQIEEMPDDPPMFSSTVIVLIVFGVSTCVCLSFWIYVIYKRRNEMIRSNHEATVRYTNNPGYVHNAGLVCPPTSPPRYSPTVSISIGDMPNAVPPPYTP